MKTEVKVAWAKDHPINASIQEALRAGQNFDHSELIDAVGDPDGQRVFKGNRLVHSGTSAELQKSDFVVFQYGVYLRDRAGRVACFRRAKREQGQDRITWGASVLLGSSTPHVPDQATQDTLRDGICVDTRQRIGRVEPRGMLWNPLPPKGLESRPTYLMAIYEHVLPDGLKLFGRWKTSPDSFHDWVDPTELPELLKQSGYIDKTIGAGIAAGHFEATDEGPGGLLYSPGTDLIAPAPKSPPPRMEYTYGHNVFISHAAEDTFTAYALHRLLIEESSRAIYPTVDLDELTDGVRMSKLDRLVGQCDALVVVITPSLLAKSKARAETGEKDWVQYEVEMALAANKPVLGFKLGTLELPTYLPQDLIANDKALYADWQKEVQRLISSVQARFGS